MVYETPNFEIEYVTDIVTTSPEQDGNELPIYPLW